MTVNAQQVKQEYAQKIAQGKTPAEAEKEIKLSFRQRLLQERKEKEEKAKTSERLIRRLENFANKKIEEKKEEKNPERWHLPPEMSYEQFLGIFAKMAASYHYNITRGDFKLKLNEQFEKALKFLHKYMTSSEWKGIFLFGSYGTGKTMTVSILAEMLKVVTYPEEFEPKIITAQGIIEKHWEAHQNKDKTEVNLIKFSKLLIIDDLGLEEIDQVNFFGNKIKPIQNIIEYRYKTGKLTWFTSNWLPQDLTQKYSGYIIDRLRQMCYFIPFNWKSYRN